MASPSMVILSRSAVPDQLVARLRQEIFQGPGKSFWGAHTHPSGELARYCSVGLTARPGVLAGTFSCAWRC